jgi:subtilase family serine protease
MGHRHLVVHHDPCGDYRGINRHSPVSRGQALLQRVDVSTRAKRGATRIMTDHTIATIIGAVIVAIIVGMIAIAIKKPGHFL